MRHSNRSSDSLRAVSLTPGFSRHAEGSCLVKFGDTHVLCTASLEEKAPPFLKGGSFPVGGELHYQACDKNACYPPKKLAVDFNVSLR